jgi:FdhD protein
MPIRLTRSDAGTGEPNAARTSTARRRVTHARDGTPQARTDILAVEEPLEIRLYPPDGSPYAQVAVTMRTPGYDFELAAGFLFTEGILQLAEDIQSIRYCTDPDVDGAQQYNIVNVVLRSGIAFDADRLRRNFYTTSSCGVCGKASIEAIHVRGIGPVADDGLVVDGEVFSRLADQLRSAQAIFEKTGGLHAAGLFDRGGSLQALREDVGRHNAVDKLIGHAFLGRMLPLRHHLMMVSGRASFEIIQKAAAAGIPLVASVSAPSSLACDTARSFGMTLVGFVRGTRFTVYTGSRRIRLKGQEIPPQD